MRFVLGLISIAIAATSVSAAEKEANSRITAVTVFPRAAEVNREATVSLDAGNHTLIFRDLPARLLADSIRVEGTATGDLEIGSVDTQTVLLPEDESATRERRKLEDDIERLEDERTSVAGGVATAQAQKTLIVNLATLPKQPGPRDRDKGARSPAEWSELAALIGREMQDIQKSIQQAAIEDRRLSREVADLRRKLVSIPPRRIQRTEVRVNVSAAQTLEANLNIRYQVADASWVPVYEARLEFGKADGKPALAITRRARVSQRTGEGWDNVRLTLSTTEPRRGTSPPRVGTVRVIFEPKRPELARSQRLEEMEMDADEAPAALAPGVSDGFAKLVKPKRAVDRRRATVVRAPFQAIYVIAGGQTVPTDGAVRRVEIDRLDFRPTLQILAAPRIRATAFLTTKLKVGEGERILPGAVSLFRDGVFVGRGHLPVLTSGQEHELGFGRDDAVRIDHVVLTKKTGETGIISTSKTDTRRFKTTVTNGHQRPINVRIIDQLPVSGDEDIEVATTSGTTAPSVTDLDDKPGVLAWDFALKPNAEKVITFGFQITWPDGKNIRFVRGR